MLTHRQTDRQKRQKLYTLLAYFVCKGYNYIVFILDGQNEPPPPTLTNTRRPPPPPTHTPPKKKMTRNSVFIEDWCPQAMNFQFFYYYHLHIGSKLLAKFHELNSSSSLDILFTRKVWHTDEQRDGHAQSNMSSQLLRSWGHNEILHHMKFCSNPLINSHDTGQ